MVPPGEVGNLLQVHRDIPNQYDAWDIDRHYRHTVIDLDRAECVTAGPVTAGVGAVRVTRRFGDSTIEHRITLTQGSPSVQVSTEIDWHERQKLLKLAFPVDVAADRSASETQFGHVFRPTHTNTSWDAARFEICAHRWIHVGEPGFGVAIANDSTYGHDVTRAARSGGGTFATVRLSLVRAPLYPDPDADQGRQHFFRVSITPGADIADAVRAGYQADLPLRSVRGARNVAPIVTVTDPAVVVEAVKLAEDRSGDVVVRVYESLGCRVTATVQAGFGAADVRVTDLLERPLRGTASRAGGVIVLQLRPFELVTLRFTPHNSDP